MSVPRVFWFSASAALLILAVSRPLNYDEITDNLTILCKRQKKANSLGIRRRTKVRLSVCWKASSRLRSKNLHTRAKRRLLPFDDGQNSEIVRLNVSYGSNPYFKLDELHEVARRAALNVEGKLSQVSDILKRI
jgi:hypothetical protein